MGELMHISRVIRNMNRELTPEYRMYMLSRQWREKREQILARANGRCERCQEEAALLQVHHITYERFGNEDLNDLRALCPRCHDREDLKRQQEKSMETQKERRIRESKA